LEFILDNILPWFRTSFSTTKNTKDRNYRRLPVRATQDTSQKRGEPGDSQETPRRLPGDTQETPRRHPGDSQETPRRSQRHPGDTQETPGGTQRHPGGIQEDQRLKTLKMLIFACYLQHIWQMDEKVHGMHKEFDMLDDFTLIFTGVNPATPYLVWEWRR
jgi:hypothetical protein